MENRPAMAIPKIDAPMALEPCHTMKKLVPKAMGRKNRIKRIATNKAKLLFISANSFIVLDSARVNTVKAIPAVKTQKIRETSQCPIIAPTAPKKALGIPTRVLTKTISNAVSMAVFFSPFSDKIKMIKGMLAITNATILDFKTVLCIQPTSTAKMKRYKGTNKVFCILHTP
jgi:hypothetical protein